MTVEAGRLTQVLIWNRPRRSAFSSGSIKRLKDY